MIETAEKFIKRKENEVPKKIKVKDIGREGFHYWVIKKRVCIQQSNYSEKVFIFERLERDKTEGKFALKMKGKEGDVEYRIGYYIIGKIRNRKDKWTWGQYCPFIPEKDFEKLVKKAKEKGVISM